MARLLMLAGTSPRAHGTGRDDEGRAGGGGGGGGDKAVP